jgi:hypothetical protein
MVSKTSIIIFVVQEKIIKQRRIRIVVLQAGTAMPQGSSKY